MAELSVEFDASIKKLIRKNEIVQKGLKETGLVADQMSDKLQESGLKSAKGVSTVGKSVTSLALKSASAVAVIFTVIEAIELMGKSGNKISGTLESLSGGVSALTEAQRELSEATRKGIAAAETEIATLEILLRTARDEAETKERRQEAIDRINKEYKKYLPNLTQENINTREVKKAIDDLNVSIVRQAKIKALQALLTKQTIALLEAEQKSALDAANGWDILFATIKTGANPSGLGLEIVNRGLKRQGDNVDRINKKIKELTKNLSTILKEDLENDFTPTIVPEIDTSEITKTTIYTDDELAQIFGLTDDAIDKISSQAIKLSETVNNALKDAAKPVKAYTSDIENSLLDFNDAASEIIKNAISDTFIGLGEGIGSALAEGKNIFDSLGKSLLGSLGAVLTQLGVLAIETGVGLLAVQFALNTINPYVAIAAGVALVAIGSAFSSGTKNIGSSSFGSGSGAGSGAVSGQGSSSGVSTFRGGGGGSFSGNGEVVFRIQGQTLVGVLSNTLEANKRLGGNISIN